MQLYHLDCYGYRDMSIYGEFKIELNKIDKNNKPNLFLHACCAPCSSEVLDILKNYFNIYIIFYTSNIDTYEEFNHRLNEFEKLKTNMYFDNIKIIYGDYNHQEFLDFVKGYENEKEGGARCEKCFILRLNKTYGIANDYIKNNNMENEVNYITTTLTISPHKNAILINNILKNVLQNSNIKYLPSDFKKEDGYLNSIKLSKKFDLYRQNYCGCEFSKNM